MLLMEKIPGQIGFMVLSLDGVILESGGDLTNDDRTASIISQMISITNFKGTELKNGSYNKVTLIYDDICYVVCLSNKKIHIVKRIKTITPAIQNGNSSTSNLRLLEEV